MNVLIKFTQVGGDAEPFNLYTNVDGFTAAFASGVTRAQLIAGFPANISDSATVVRVRSISACNNFTDIPVPGVTTTTSSSTTVTTITTTTTTTTLPMAYPVVDACCGITPGTHYVSAPLGTFNVGEVFSSNSFGYFGAFMVSGPMEPGIVDVVRYDSTIYGSCFEWSNIYPGNISCQ